MSSEARDYLARQLDTAWKLTEIHLEGLTTGECLWRPGARGPHVHQSRPDGEWRGDWPDREGYDIGPPSIAWLTWHMGFWWSMAFDHSFGDGSLSREDVTWPGEGRAVGDWIARLKHDWSAALDRVSDADLRSDRRTQWPFKGRPFGDVVAWVNIELMKNAAEIGYARFLYAARAEPSL